MIIYRSIKSKTCLLCLPIAFEFVYRISLRRRKLIKNFLTLHQTTAFVVKQLLLDITHFFTPSSPKTKFSFQELVKISALYLVWLTCNLYFVKYDWLGFFPMEKWVYLRVYWKVSFHIISYSLFVFHRRLLHVIVNYLLPDLCEMSCDVIWRQNVIT